MIKLSICVEMIYAEIPFAERLDKVKSAGINAYEFWNWKNKDLSTILAGRKNGLQLTAFTGSSVELTSPAKREDAILSIKESIDFAKKVNSANLIIVTGQEQEDIKRSQQQENIIQVLEAVVGDAEKAGITLVLEPLNTLINHKGYYLASSFEGYDIIQKVASPNLKLLFDIYHQQITEGNIINNIKDHIDLIGHFHLADVPGRQEPGTGELNYANILQAIVDTGYDRYVGCEFKPSVEADKSLQIMKNLLPES